MMITLEAWEYEHIAITFPQRLIIPRFVDNVRYALGILRWRYDYYIHPTNGIHRDVRYYHRFIIQLIPDHVKFHPY